MKYRIKWEIDYYPQKRFLFMWFNFRTNLNNVVRFKYEDDALEFIRKYNKGINIKYINVNEEEL